MGRKKNKNVILHFLEKNSNPCPVTIHVIKATIFFYNSSHVPTPLANASANCSFFTGGMSQTCLKSIKQVWVHSHTTTAC